jgi:hypothetical protein
MALRTLALTATLSCASALAQTTVLFRDGASPSPSYAGTRDLLITDQSYAEPYWNPDATFDLARNHIDEWPSRKAPLIRFDVSSLPPGTNVLSASLSYEVTNESLNGTAQMFRLLRPWVDTEATWRRPRAGETWAIPGARGVGIDVDGVGLGQLAAPALGPQTVSLDAATVQGWVDAPAANHGLLWRSVSLEDGFDFGACDFGTAGQRLSLTVVHGVSPGTTTVFRNGVSPTAGYAGCEDTFIASGPNLSVGWNGGGLRVALAPAGPFHFAALLSFDLSTLPPTSRVREASLELFVRDTVSQPRPAHGLTRAWSETSATWTGADETTAWATPGALAGQDYDLAAAADLTATAPGPVSVPLNAAGVQLVQDWISGARANHGFIVPAPAASSNLVYGDREDGLVTARPGLSLVLEPPTPFTIGCGCQSSQALPLAVLAALALVARPARRYPRAPI